jgi:hypothetical protein
VASPPTNKIARWIAGAAVLLTLLIVGVLLIPPYAANWRLQNYVNDVADDPATAKEQAGAVRTQVLSAAASLGVPLHSEDVHVDATPAGVRIEVLYIVHVEMAGYTIDLHFRPTGGG